MTLRVGQVVAEFGGLAQTGGLADAVAALSKELKRLGQDVKIFLPLYGSIDMDSLDLLSEPTIRDIEVTLGGRKFPVVLRPASVGDEFPTVYLIDCPDAFDREAIYDNAGDEHLRFALLSRAALEGCRRSAWKPAILHCHDWHAGLLPLYLKTLYSRENLFAGVRTVLTIHNLAYQGVFSRSAASDLGLKKGASPTFATPGQRPVVNFLATGIRHADMVSTVSPTYAREIVTAEHGMGLDRLLASRGSGVTGILNGVDYEIWNPASDPLIAANYSATALEGKEVCRRSLLQDMSLDPDPSGPVLGIVSRLAQQKGFEVVGEVLPEILADQDIRLVVLGTGEDQFERLFEKLADESPRKVAFRRTFDPALAHQIEAGSDVFLMPSRFEPCGLNQMYSLKYGTVPIVHRIGGLADTVEQFDDSTGRGTGFVFEPFAAAPFQSALESALGTFRDSDSWRRLTLNGMSCDFSWARQVERYLEMYRSVLGDRSKPPDA